MTLTVRELLRSSGAFANKSVSVNGILMRDGFDGELFIVDDKEQWSEKDQAILIKHNDLVGTIRAAGIMTMVGGRGYGFENNCTISGKFEALSKSGYSHTISDIESLSIFELVDIDEEGQEQIMEVQIPLEK